MEIDIALHGQSERFGAQYVRVISLGVRMNKQDLLEILRYIREELKEDEERSHLAADEALLDYINDDDVTKAFNMIKKWYA